MHKNFYDPCFDRRMLLVQVACEHDIHIHDQDIVFFEWKEVLINSVQNN